MTSEKQVCGMRLSPREEYEDDMKRGFTELALATAETGDLGEEAINAAKVADFEKEMEMGNYSTAAFKAKLYGFDAERIKIAERESAKPPEETKWYQTAMAKLNEEITWIGTLRHLLRGRPLIPAWAAQLEDPDERAYARIKDGVLEVRCGKTACKK